jgi:hypothetical protein
MSFFIDPPLLFIVGLLIYFKCNQYARFTKVIISLVVVFIFVFNSVLLYLDIIPCFYPFICYNLNGSEFMFNSNITGICKQDVPLFIAVLLFALYPLWLYAGYASAKILSKNKSRILKNVKIE